MDRAETSRLLEVTERRVEDAADRIVRQRRIVADFERTPEACRRSGRQVAADILEQLELSHRIMLQQCARLRRELAQRVRGF